MNRLMRTSLLGVFCVLALSACRSTPAPPPRASDLTETRNLHVAGPYYLAGQPTAAELETFKQAGVKSVINLRQPDEFDDFDEPGRVTSMGMHYYAVPFGSPDTLTDAVFDRGRQLLRDAEQPVLLHCASANRVGAIWLAKRALDDGVDIEQAAAEAKTVGMRTEAYEKLARDYIQRNR